MFGGMKRELIPGRWQVAVEGLIGFVDDMVGASIGPEGKKYLPWVFTAFIFLLFANLMGNMPFGIVAGDGEGMGGRHDSDGRVASLITLPLVDDGCFYTQGLHVLRGFVPLALPWCGICVLFLS